MTFIIHLYADCIYQVERNGTKVFYVRTNRILYIHHLESDVMSIIQTTDPEEKKIYNGKEKDSFSHLLLSVEHFEH